MCDLELEFFVRVQVISPFGGNTPCPPLPSSPNPSVPYERNKRHSAMAVQRLCSVTTYIDTYPHRLELRLEPTRAGFEPKENKVGASLYGTQIQTPADLGPWPHLLTFIHSLTYLRFLTHLHLPYTKSHPFIIFTSNLYSFSF